MVRDGKTYKIALAQLRVWKINTQNMCKRRRKLCTNLQKWQKVHKKRIFLKPREKPKKIAQLWKISTGGAALPSYFSISDCESKKCILEILNKNMIFLVLFISQNGCCFLLVRFWSFGAIKIFVPFQCQIWIIKQLNNCICMIASRSCNIFRLDVGNDKWSILL